MFEQLLSSMHSLCVGETSGQNTKIITYMYLTFKFLMMDIKICQEVKSGMEKNEARLENREFVIAVKITILNRVSEDPLLVKVILEQSPKRWWKKTCGCLGRNIPGRRSTKWKSHEMGAYVAHPRNSREAIVAGGIVVTGWAVRYAVGEVWTRCWCPGHGHSGCGKDGSFYFDSYREPLV